MNVPGSDNFTNSELQASYWYVTHAVLLRRTAIVLLSIVCILLWVYVLVVSYHWIAADQMERAQIASMLEGDASLQEQIQRLLPRPLQLASARVVPSSGGRSDIIVDVTNPNPNWVAVFTYGLNSGGGEYKGFILPGERAPVLVLGAANPGQVELRDMAWQRVSAAEVSRVLERYLQLVVTDEVLVPPAAAGDPTRVIFTLTNASAYSYWHADVHVLLYAGGSLAAVNQITLDQLRAGESRLVEVNFPGRYPGTLSTEISARINPFDPAAIMPPVGDPVSDR